MLLHCGLHLQRNQIPSDTKRHLIFQRMVKRNIDTRDTFFYQWIFLPLQGSVVFINGSRCRDSPRLLGRRLTIGPSNFPLLSFHRDPLVLSEKEAPEGAILCSEWAAQWNGRAQADALGDWSQASGVAEAPAVGQTHTYTGIPRGIAVLRLLGMPLLFNGVIVSPLGICTR